MVAVGAVIAVLAHSPLWMDGVSLSTSAGMVGDRCQLGSLLRGFFVEREHGTILSGGMGVAGTTAAGGEAVLQGGFVRRGR